MTIGTILTSGVIAAIVSGIVALRNSERKISVENITQERTKWREKIREINKRVHEAYKIKDSNKIELNGSELRLLLNPLDDLDADILSEIDVLIKTDASPKDIERFSVKLSLLLKHDWERAKQESKDVFYKKQELVKRITYQEYINKMANKPN